MTAKKSPDQRNELFQHGQIARFIRRSVPEAPIEAPQPGSYSIVILRRVADGKVQTQLVAGEVYAKPGESVANVYNLAAALDLNRDGKLEVIVHSFYYEGSQTTIYRCQPGQIEALLSVECGV